MGLFFIFKLYFIIGSTIASAAEKPQIGLPKKKNEFSVVVKSLHILACNVVAQLLGINSRYQVIFHSNCFVTIFFFYR